MTRSVEIPEAAVEVAAQQLHPTLWDGQPGNRHAESARADARERVRLVLSAALPYLAPAAESDAERAMADHLNPQGIRCSSPAPAGDGGLREALVESRAALESMRMFVYVETPTAVGTVEELERVLGVVKAALAAHPAALAVPQPVDREALVKAIAGPSGDWLSRHQAGIAADRVLALLTGEQEQVEP